MFKPEGVYAAMMTPFDDEGNINEEVVRRIVDFYIDKGVEGLFPVSSVGEFVHLSLEECMQLMDIVTDQAGGRVPVTPGVAASCTEKSVLLARHAEEIGCDGVVVPPPYYYTVSQEIIEKHFETVADSVGISIILYNIPLFSNPISYDVVKRLSRRENVVAMKDSSGNMVDVVHFMDKVRLVGEDMNVLIGREDILFPALMVGCKGCMVVTAGILPEIMLGIYRSWERGDYDRARELQFSILLLIRAMFSLPFPIGFKAALEVRGFPMGPPKQPLSEAEEYSYIGTRSRIERIMGELLESVGEGAQTAL